VSAVSKLGEFYVNVLDVFSGLLPGAVTVGAAFVLDVVARPSELLRSFPLHTETERGGAFLLAAYVVGQAANSVGALVLDPLYDLLYRPGSGLLSPPRETNPPTSRLARAMEALMHRSREGLDATQEELLRAELDRLSHARPEGEAPDGPPEPLRASVYRRIRVYLRLCMPDAYVDVEKLEGEQKFFRALAVGVLGLAALLRFGPRASRHADLAGLLVALALMLFVRYVSVRRKTVLLACLFFRARDWPARPRTKAAKEPPEESDD